MYKVKHLTIILTCILAACTPKNNEEAFNTGTTDNTAVNRNKPFTAGTGSSEEATKSEGVNRAPRSLGLSSADGIHAWQLSGAIAARNKAKSWSAGINWAQQGPSTYQIRLSGPIGAGTVLINRNGNTITYKDGPKTLSSASAEDLLMKQSGIRLPISNLYYWVRGLPAPGSVESIQKDPKNHALKIRQNGYTVEYAGYNGELPTRMRLYGNGVVIKLAIRRWTVA